MDEKINLRRRRKAALVVAAFLVTAAILVGCGRSSLRIGWRGSDLPKRKTARCVSFSGVEAKSLRLAAGQTVELDYDVEVDKGTLMLSLVDPDGETLWEETFEEGEADEVELRAAQSGRYRLRIEGESTQGSYEISWDVRDQ